MLSLLAPSAASAANTCTFVESTLDVTCTLDTAATTIVQKASTTQNVQTNVSGAFVDLGKVNEVQTVTVDATSGNFTLTFAGQTTGNLAFNATSAAVDTALEGLSNIGVGDVAVTGNAGGPYTITFGLLLGQKDVAQITATNVDLAGGGATVTTATTTQGSIAATVQNIDDFIINGSPGDDVVQINAKDLEDGVGLSFTSALGNGTDTLRVNQNETSGRVIFGEADDGTPLVDWGGVNSPTGTLVPRLTSDVNTENYEALGTTGGENFSSAGIDINTTIDNPATYPVTFNGGAGNDTFRLGQGADTVNGGAGTDLLDLSVHGGAQNVSLDGVANDGNAAAANEVQVVTLNGATGGTWDLKFDGLTTPGDLAFNASAADVQTALEGLANIGVGDVTVTGVAGGPYTVEFTGALASTDVNLLDHANALTDADPAAPNPAITHSTPWPGTAIDNVNNVGADVENVTFGNGDDTFTTTNASIVNNVIRGGGGSDTITGGGGTLDQLFGDGVAGSLPGGVDNLSGGDGADRLYADNHRAVGDVYSGGLGIDTLYWNERAEGLRVDLDGDADDGAAEIPGTNEVQSLTVDATSGNYTLTFGADVTPNIAFNADAATVDAALEALASIGANNVAVSGGPGGTAALTITFEGALASQNVGQITATNIDLAGGGATVTTSTTTQGVATTPQEGDNAAADIENVYTGAGNDTLIAQQATTVRNFLHGGGGADYFHGGPGDDSFDKSGAAALGNVVFGGAGTDKLLIYDHLGNNLNIRTNNIADDGVGGDDNIRSDVEVLFGSNGANVIVGGSANNLMYGLGGNDTLSGGVGVDKMFGGNGNDTITGGSGKDTLRGGSGADVLNGGGSVDYMSGEAGNDDFFARDGNSDYVSGGTGTDDAKTHDGDDRLRSIELT